MERSSRRLVTLAGLVVMVAVAGCRSSAPPTPAPPPAADASTLTSTTVTINADCTTSPEKAVIVLPGSPVSGPEQAIWDGSSIGPKRDFQVDYLTGGGQLPNTQYSGSTSQNATSGVATQSGPWCYSVTIFAEDGTQVCSLDPEICIKRNASDCMGSGPSPPCRKQSAE